jgi:hypothetical protein
MYVLTSSKVKVKRGFWKFTVILIISSELNIPETSRG